MSVLADPTRASILRLMHESDDGRVLVGRIAEALDLRQPTVSHHMRALLDEGIVTRTPEGRRVWYAIAPAEADRVRTLLGPSPTSEVSTPDLARISADLAERFRGTFGPETIEHYVRESHRLLSTDSSTPLLASRTSTFAASRLDSLARSHDPATVAPMVLFVCVQNAGRSQLAAAIMQHLAGDRIVIRTAGSAPADEVRGAIVRALDEIGVALGGEFPKPLTDEVVRAADVVVTMGCGDACPVYPGRRYLDWGIPDPVGRPTTEVRVIRDDIERRVRELLSDLGQAP